MATTLCLDGNEAAARVAYALSRGHRHLPDHAGLAHGRGRGRLERRGADQPLGRGARGDRDAVRGGRRRHAARRAAEGALATTFTASQGLLLMLPNMFKIAGELTPAVIHVAARAVATHALSIFGDHSDVMAARTHRAWRCSARRSVQEAHDFAARGPRRHAALPGAVPPLLRRLPHLARDRPDRAARRRRPAGAGRRGGIARATAPGASTPDRPVLRGTAQNPDVFFQAREAANPFHAAVPGSWSRRCSASWPTAPAAATGWSTTRGAPDAERVVVLMGSGAGAAQRGRRRALGAAARRSGLLTVRLYRPFPAERARRPPCRRRCPPSPCSTAPRSPARSGEPLYLDVRRRAGRGRTAAARPGPAAGDRRPLRPGVQGVHPGDGQGGLRRAGRRRSPSATSPSASSTTSPT